MSLRKGHYFALKVMQKMRRKILTVSRRLTFSHADNGCDSEGDLLPDYYLPKDVKEGHFVVHTVGNGEIKRFVINLSYLANPSFLRLLNKAEEEFGFEQEGVLAVPCRPSELLSILESMNERSFQV